MKGNTFPAVDGSCSDMTLAGKNMLDQMAECCRTKSALMEQGGHCSQAKLEKASWVRSTRMRSCRTNVSYRSEWMILRSSGNQPGETRYRMSMPVAAGAKAARAPYHSHTAVAVRRDDCKMVRLKVPGFALAISTGDPAFRLKWSSPGGQQSDRLNKGLASRYVNYKCPFGQIKEVARKGTSSDKVTSK